MSTIESKAPLLSAMGDEAWDGGDIVVNKNNYRKQQRRSQPPKEIKQPDVIPSSSSLTGTNDSPRKSTREAESWLLGNRRDKNDYNPVETTTTTTTTPTDTRSDKPTTATTVTTTPSTVSSTSFGSAIPVAHVNTITAAFGRQADLYADVLGIARNASARDVRIAYFRRGRQVLSGPDHPVVAPLSSPSSAASSPLGGEITSSSKLRFQAVSMAYEILSDPSWKAFYDQHGLQSTAMDVFRHKSIMDNSREEEEEEEDDEEEDDDLESVQSNSVASVRSTPILRHPTHPWDERRRSRSIGRTRSSGGGGGVRWNEQVEELVYKRDPTEMQPKDLFGRRKKVPKKKKKRRKPRVIVETDTLQRHLENLDQQSERHFVTDFLDELENSIEDLLSLGSKEEPDDDKDQDRYDDDDDEDDDDGDNDGFEERKKPTGRSDETISTLSDSVVGSPGLASYSPSSPQAREVVPSSSANAAPFSPLMEPYEYDPGCGGEPWCGRLDETLEPLPADGTPRNASNNNNNIDPTTPSFQAFLMTYLQSLASDLYTWGSTFQQQMGEWDVTTMLDTVMISEDDLEGMLGILRMELDQTPCPTTTTSETTPTTATNETTLG